jgi:hypothetical protein
MSPMDLSRHTALALRDSHAAALASVAADAPFPLGLFCNAPTVLQAINRVRCAQGRPVLRVQADGTIGPADPILLRIEYTPSPFVC